MATDPSTTGMPPRVPTSADFDLTKLDDVSSKMDVLKSLIWVAIDLQQADAYHAENLMHGALLVHQVCDEAICDVHNDLLAIRREASNG
ncbi:hypothetical protein [Sphingomonas qomolangmaensis]|uniref:Uncharacterized protein n=1 Tax=Sphingomonas qomolangmaensis TaxID=2918765 RepID=A0ABY5L9J1_9SPHN|nr:hypothetical protein [Sphingomonas qomolangmaensis]UUL83457.1 hypothetical protein NMP03_04300 [Sphingomonas qomolangmaensis]